MKLTINTDILEKHSLSLGEFLLILLGYFGIDISKSKKELLDKNYIEKNLFRDEEFILSDNNKYLIARILVESDEKIIASGIDFENLASQLMDLYPNGNKPGTTYSWKGKQEDIAFKLRTLIANYNHSFTEEEAINAVRNYVSSFTESKQDMLLLRSFILRIVKESNNKEATSLFMDWIENNRD